MKGERDLSRISKKGVEKLIEFEATPLEPPKSSALMLLPPYGPQQLLGTSAADIWAGVAC